MQFTTVFTLIAGASLAMAAAIPEANAPTYGGSEPSSGPTCSNQQQQACCKGNDSNGSGLLGDVLGGILGGNCELSIRKFDSSAHLLVNTHLRGALNW